MANPAEYPTRNETEECSSAHDIASLADLPGRRMKTKLWPMSPIESLSEEEVMAIASRDETPVLIATMEGDDSGEKYLCSNKKGVTPPPEVAAEGTWAKKYYQQVAVLSDSLKELQKKYLPVWELTRSQQALLVSVEVFDGLMAVANQGLQSLFKTWSKQQTKAIITTACDFRSTRQVNYYTVLKNYTAGSFGSLDVSTLRSVEDLLLAGENFLTNHASTNGFHCPPDIRALFQEFLPLKKGRNEYSHPLTLAKGRVASTVLERLRASIENDELDFIKGTKNLVLLGADYAESILQSYGKVREKLFLDPKKTNAKRRRSDDSDYSPEESPRPKSLRIHEAPGPHIGESSHRPSLPGPPTASLSLDPAALSYGRAFPPLTLNPRSSPRSQQSPITPASLGTPRSNHSSPRSQSSGFPHISGGTPRSNHSSPRSQISGSLHISGGPPPAFAPSFPRRSSRTPTPTDFFGRGEPPPTQFPGGRVPGPTPSTAAHATGGRGPALAPGSAYGGGRGPALAPGPAYGGGRGPALAPGPAYGGGRGPAPAPGPEYGGRGPAPAPGPAYGRRGQRGGGRGQTGDGRGQKRGRY